MQDVRLQIAASRKREGAHLADSVGVGLSSAATVDLTKATDRYQQGVDLEMGLLGLGSTQAALSHERRPLTGAHLDRARPTSADCGEPVRP
jgi:hypothetical protein